MDRRGFGAAALAAGLLVAVATRCQAARGGPDSFGYRWIDRNEPNYGTVSETFTSSSAFTTLGDETVEAINLPFSFPFYGTSYTRVHVSSNGWLSFTDPVGQAYPSSAPIFSPGPPNNLLAFSWDDLVINLASSSHGPASNGAYMIFLYGSERIGGNLVNPIVMLYPTGAIRIYWSQAGNAAAKTVGIENGSGSDGLQVWRNGVGTNGAALADDYGVAFYPPPNLSCTSPAPTPINCGQKLTAQTNVGGPTRVTSYGGVVGTFLGPEKTFSFTLTRASNITLSLTNTARALRLALIGPACHEVIDCIDGGKTTITRNFLPPGNYTVVVDGVAASDAGTFDLELTCRDSANLATCDGTAISGNIAAGSPSVLTDWLGCNAAPTFGAPGGENVYEVTIPPTGGNLIADLVSGPPNLYVLIADSAVFDPAFPTCVAAGATHAPLYNATPGKTYYIVVDDTDPARSGGAYQLQISCAVKLSCGSPQPIDITNPAPIQGSTVGQPNNVENYWCTDATTTGADELRGYSGGETAYRFSVPPGAVVGFYFSSPNPDVKPFILKSCNEGQCINQINCVEGVPAGDYLLVIDGLNGARADFTLAPFTVAAPVGFKRWYDCFECIDTQYCNPQTEVPKTAQDTWHFGSANFCGWGCTYAMYVVAECGTELHLPMWDVETGDVKVFDVLRNRYVDLTGTGPMAPACTSGLWPQNSQNIKWKDSGCTASPCVPSSQCGQCGGGADFCTNNDPADPTRTTPIDISFQGNPSGCGVYRLEFYNMGGCEWFLYANCDGSATPRYPIYRDICSAMSDFHPYPDLVLTNVRIDNTPCSSLQANVIVDVTNQGCVPAANVPVEITDGTTTQTFFMGDILAGRVASRTFLFGPVSATPATLTVTVDPGTPGSVTECREVPNTKSCGSTSGQRTVNVSACPNTCSTLAEAGLPEMTVCEGAAVLVDGRDSALFSNCLTSGPLQYQWKIDGNIITGCAFSTTTTCNIPASLVTSGLHIVELEVRCAGAPTQCSSTDTILLNSNADVPPPAVGNTLRGIHSSSARDDIAWSWGSVVDPGLSGYGMWRHVAKADMPTRANRTSLGQTPPSTTTLTETNGVRNPPALALYQAVGLSCSKLNESPY